MSIDCALAEFREPWGSIDSKTSNIDPLRVRHIVRPRPATTRHRLPTGQDITIYLCPRSGGISSIHSANMIWSQYRLLEASLDEVSSIEVSKLPSWVSSCISLAASLLRLVDFEVWIGSVVKVLSVWVKSSSVSSSAWRKAKLRELCLKESLFYDN